MTGPRAKKTTEPPVADNPACRFPGCHGRLSDHPVSSKTCWCRIDCPCTGFTTLTPAAVKKAADAEVDAARSVAPLMAPPEPSREP